jgi:hypothetical protein
VNFPLWRKASRSNSTAGNECVELADLGGTVGIRDSKDSQGPRLELTPSTFMAFVGRIKAGELDQ